MKYLSSLLCGVVVLGMLVGRPHVVLAQQEHGGQEHAGQEPGGAVSAEPDPGAVLNEAAAALDLTDAALAGELRAWAEGTATGDKNATLSKAAEALQASDPDLAEKLRAMIEEKEHGGEATA